MPIAYTCPHCGKQFSVAEQYAGQTGPCASCGQSITIPPAPPLPGYAYGPAATVAPARRTNSGVQIAAIIAGVLAVPCILGLIARGLMPAVHVTREASQRMQAQNQLRQ